MAALDKRFYTRMSDEMRALVKQEARRLGVDQSEWMRLAAVHFALACRLADLADENPGVDLRDPATIARLLGD